MSNHKLLNAMCRQACRMVRELNERMDEPFFYLTSCAGRFRLYGGDGNCDRLIMEGRVCIEGVAKLISRLEAVSICI